jgi:hypothetical protein
VEGKHRWTARTLRDVTSHNHPLRSRLRKACGSYCQPICDSHALVRCHRRSIEWFRGEAIAESWSHRSTESNPPEPRTGHPGVTRPPGSARHAHCEQRCHQGLFPPRAERHAAAAAQPHADLVGCTNNRMAAVNAAWLTEISSSVCVQYWRASSSSRLDKSRAASRRARANRARTYSQRMRRPARRGPENGGARRVARPIARALALTRTGTRPAGRSGQRDGRVPICVMRLIVTLARAFAPLIRGWCTDCKSAGQVHPAGSSSGFREPVVTLALRGCETTPTPMERDT